MKIESELSGLARWRLSFFPSKMEENDAVLQLMSSYFLQSDSLSSVLEIVRNKGEYGP